MWLLFWPKTIKELKKEWESGKLKESVAYAFAKNSPEVQRATARYMKDRLHSNCEYWHEANVTYITEKIAKELKPKKGPRGTCESCDHTESRLLRMAGKSMYDDHCNNGKCCHDCPNLGTCPYACPHLSGEVAKAREVAKAKQAKEKERKDKKNGTSSADPLYCAFVPADDRLVHTYGGGEHH